MYLNSTSATINATLTKNGQLQAIEGILKFTAFTVGDSEIDYRLNESSLTGMKIMEAGTNNNQLKSFIIRDLPQGSVSPAQLYLSKTTLNLNNGNSTFVTVRTLYGTDKSYNIYNPRFDLVTLIGNNTSNNGLNQLLSVDISNSVSSDNISVISKNNESTFIIEVNDGIPIADSFVLTIIGNDTGATEQLIINTNQ